MFNEGSKKIFENAEHNLLNTMSEDFRYQNLFSFRGTTVPKNTQNCERSV